MRITPTPWIACKSHEDEKGLPYFDIEPEEKHEYDDAPYTSIYGSDGETVVNAHDLFTFRHNNAQHICKCVNLHEALVKALEKHLSTLLDVDPTDIELLKKAKE